MESAATKLSKASGSWSAVGAVDAPEPEGKSAVQFAGVQHNTFPIKLMTDNRLTPLDRNAWLVFRLMMDQSGFAGPNYHELRQYLPTIAYGKLASKETVARVITILRLSRWVTLVSRKRDEITGQMEGCLYIVYDEPVTVAETSELDAEYAKFVAACLSHPNKSVRLVAAGAMDDIETSDGRLPTRLEVIASRVAERSRRNQNQVDRHRIPVSSESEPRQKPLGLESEPGQKSLSSESVLGVRNPSSESEPGDKPTKTDRVRNPNQAQYSTVLSTNTSTKRTVLYDGQDFDLYWPNAVRLTETENREILKALSGLSPDVQQMVLDEAGSRIAAGGIRNHNGYLFSLVSKAKAGTFKLWAASQRLESVPTGDSHVSTGDGYCASGTQQQHKPNQGAPPVINGVGPPAVSSEPRGPRPVSDTVRRLQEEIRASISRRSG